ncbi:hypothetical protein SSX86_032900 [Deinandra increscens subsp. villosa]|uniref:Late embryogenesis abundant protein LEA-2 subgroup domain-containing protein n=1 Tax=Deinandra increscens subsp. villosa TaxID=3103831 RepID=A0AAP0C680_9ASTR
MVATVFLLLAAAAVYFLLLKPKSPKIVIDSVQFPTFSISNGTVNFTFFQFVSVTNPNREAFTHYDSSLQLTPAHLLQHVRRIHLHPRRKNQWRHVRQIRRPVVSDSGEAAAGDYGDD